MQISKRAIITYNTNELAMSKTQESSLDGDRLEQSTEILRALAHPLRMRILAFINENESINVNKIYSTLELEQSITSQHLSILRKAGLVDTERQGKYVHYRVDYPRLKSTIEAIRVFLLKSGE